MSHNSSSISLISSVGFFKKLLWCFQRQLVFASFHDWMDPEAASCVFSELSLCEPGRWRPSWRTRAWTTCQCRWRRRPTSNTCLDSVLASTRFWLWPSRWSPWSTSKMGLASCNVTTLKDQIRFDRFSLFFYWKNCTGYVYVCLWNKSEYIDFTLTSPQIFSAWLVLTSCARRLPTISMWFSSGSNMKFLYTAGVTQQLQKNDNIVKSFQFF